MEEQADYQTLVPRQNCLSDLRLMIVRIMEEELKIYSSKEYTTQEESEYCSDLLEGPDEIDL